MKKLLLAVATAAIACSLSAASADIVSLRNYATKALELCPDSVVTISPIDQQGPSNFMIYQVKLTSSEESCNKQTYLLYSPTTQQILIASIIALPADARPVADRVADQASQMLKQSMTATVAPFPLPDGLHSVAITKKTELGAFSYHGYIDASQHFLLVGTRGSLQVDPGKTLLDSIGIEAGVRRGNPKAKLQIIEMSDFECPSCARAHVKVEPIIEKSLDKIDYIRMDLPLFEHHEWAVKAALASRAIHDVAPTKYWAYVNYVFANQEAIGKQPFDKFFKDYCEDHDINFAAAQKIYQSKTELAAMLDRVGRAFDNGVVSTPTYIVNGQRVGFGPEGAFTVKTINDALGISGGATKPAAAKKSTAAAKPATKKKN